MACIGESVQMSAPIGYAPTSANFAKPDPVISIGLRKVPAPIIESEPEKITYQDNGIEIVSQPAIMYKEHEIPLAVRQPNGRTQAKDILEPIEPQAEDFTVDSTQQIDAGLDPVLTSQPEIVDDKKLNPLAIGAGLLAAWFMFR